MRYKERLINMIELKDYIDTFYNGKFNEFERNVFLTHLVGDKQKPVDRASRTISKQINTGNFLVGEDEDGNAFIYQRKYILEER